MKTCILFITLCFLSCLMAGAQAPEIKWQKCLGGSFIEFGRSIQQTTDGGYIIAGGTQSFDGDVSGNHGSGDFWVVKLSSSGELQWQKCLGGSNYEEAYSIQQTSDGGYIVAGHTDSNNGNVSGNHGGDDYWIVKLNSTGTLQWQKCLGGSSEDVAYFVRETSDGGYIVAGYASSGDGDVTGNHGYSDYWIVKLSSEGNLQWQKCLGGTSWDYAFGIEQTTDGGYIIAGNSSSNDGDVSGNHGDDDYWVVKLNSTGDLEWQKCLGGSGLDHARSIQQHTDGGYIVAGYSQSDDGDVNGNHGIDDIWVVKISSTGTLQWENCLGGGSWDYAYSIQQTTDGGYIVSGNTYSTEGDVSGNHGSTDSWVVKLNDSGDLQWQKCMGGTNTEYAFSIQQTTDEGYIVGGLTSSNNGDVSGNHGYTDFWVVKLYAEALAIHLLDINARNEGSRNQIQWETASEDEGDCFVIERSPDGVNFEAIVRIDAKGTPGIYRYYDEQPLQGINYYRLQLNNIDGQIKHSKVVTTRMIHYTMTLSAYPNPATEKVTIKINGPKVEGARLRITDIEGKTVKWVTLQGNTIDISLQDMVQGMYFLQYRDGFYDQIIRLEIK